MNNSTPLKEKSQTPFRAKIPDLVDFTPIPSDFHYDPNEKLPKAPGSRVPRESSFFGPNFYSLNNGAGDAGVHTSKKGDDSGPGHWGSNSPPRYEGIDFDFLGATRTGWDPEQKRILLESLIAQRYPGVEWSTSFWKFVDVYGREAKKNFGILNTGIRPRADYFDLCYRAKTKGVILPAVDGTIYYDRKHCGEAGCLFCAERERKRVAGEWYEIRKQVVENHPEGFKGFLDLGFTLPRELERIPLKDPKIEKKLLDAIQDIIREMFGLNSRSNIAMNLAVHPTGSEDMFRDRWHCDPNIIPGVVENGKFRWVEPVKVSKDARHRHRPDMWKIDLPWAGRRWAEKLARIFERPVLEASCWKKYVAKNPNKENQPLRVIQPQASFIPSLSNIQHWRKRIDAGENPSDGFWRKVRHRLGYSLRSFSQDLENAVLRTDSEGERFIVKGENSDWTYWQVVGAKFLVERFKWIRAHNRIRARGWAQCARNKYRDILGIVEKEIGPSPEVFACSCADVSLVREKRFDHGKQKVVWIRDEVYSFTSPFTGKEETRSISDMEPWLWGITAYPQGAITLAPFSDPPPPQGLLFEARTSRGPPV